MDVANITFQRQPGRQGLYMADAKELAVAIQRRGIPTLAAIRLRG